MNKIFEDGKKYCGRLAHAEVIQSSNLDLDYFEAKLIFVDERGERITKSPHTKQMAHVFFDDLRRMGFAISSLHPLEDAVRAVDQIRDEIRKGKPPRIEIDIERGGLLRHILRRLPEAQLEIETTTTMNENENDEVANSDKKTKLRLQRKAIRAIEDLMDWLGDCCFSKQDKQATIARLQQTLDELAEGL